MLKTFHVLIIAIFTVVGLAMVFSGTHPIIGVVFLLWSAFDIWMNYLASFKTKSNLKP